MRTPTTLPVTMNTLPADSTHLHPLGAPGYGGGVIYCRWSHRADLAVYRHELRAFVGASDERSTLPTLPIRQFLHHKDALAVVVVEHTGTLDQPHSADLVDLLVAGLDVRARQSVADSGAVNTLLDIAERESAALRAVLLAGDSRSFSACSPLDSRSWQDRHRESDLEAWAAELLRARGYDVDELPPVSFTMELAREHTGIHG